MRRQHEAPPLQSRGNLAMTNIILVVAEHYSVPGIVTKAFDNEDKAKRECVSLVNIMLDDMGMPNADIANWEGCLAILQDIHGAAHCYVEYQSIAVE
jgi:hypothetical protein